MTKIGSSSDKHTLLTMAQQGMSVYQQHAQKLKTTGSVALSSCERKHLAAALFCKLAELHSTSTSSSGKATQCGKSKSACSPVAHNCCGGNDCHSRVMETMQEILGGTPKAKNMAKSLAELAKRSSFEEFAKAFNMQLDQRIQANTKANTKVNTKTTTSMKGCGGGCGTLSQAPNLEKPNLTKQGLPTTTVPAKGTLTKGLPAGTKLKPRAGIQAVMLARKGQTNLLEVADKSHHAKIGAQITLKTRERSPPTALPKTTGTAAGKKSAAARPGKASSRGMTVMNRRAAAQPGLSGRRTARTASSS